MRFVKGITLTPSERRQAGVDRSRNSSLLKAHSDEVSLPDGRPCTFTYRRHGPAWHEFTFDSPLARRSWSNARLANTTESILAEAATQAAGSFRTCQLEEQKSMQRKSKPKGWIDGLPDEVPRMRIQTAADLAGLYAVCVRLTNGSLSVYGPTHSQPEAAVQDLHSEGFQDLHLLGGQRLVIGICCRFARRWYEAAFVPRTEISATAEMLPPEEDDQEDLLDAA